MWHLHFNVSESQTLYRGYPNCLNCRKDFLLWSSGSPDCWKDIKYIRPCNHRQYSFQWQILKYYTQIWKIQKNSKKKIQKKNSNLILAIWHWEVRKDLCNKYLEEFFDCNQWAKTSQVESLPVRQMDRKSSHLVMTHQRVHKDLANLLDSCFDHYCHRKSN